MGFPCSNKVVKSNQITVAADRTGNVPPIHRLLPLLLYVLRVNAYVAVSMN